MYTCLYLTPDIPPQGGLHVNGICRCLYNCLLCLYILLLAPSSITQDEKDRAREISGDFDDGDAFSDTENNDTET